MQECTKKSETCGYRRWEGDCSLNTACVIHNDIGPLAAFVRGLNNDDIAVLQEAILDEEAYWGNDGQCIFFKMGGAS